MFDAIPSEAALFRAQQTLTQGETPPAFMTAAVTGAVIGVVLVIAMLALAGVL